MRINYTGPKRRKYFAALSLLGILAFQPQLLAASAGQITPPPSSPSSDETLVFFLGGIPVSFGPASTIRLTVFNPGRPQSTDGRRFKMLVAPVLLDAHGEVIAQADELEVKEGQFHSFDFNRDNLELAGEADTGRLQVRSQIRYRFLSIVDRSQILPDDFNVTLELIENNTGKTTYIQPRAFQIISAGGN